MVLLITKKDYLFESKNILFLDDGCNLKYIPNSEYVIYIDNLKTEEDGFIEETNIFLEEVLITLNVYLIISPKKTKKLQEICDNYKIALLTIEI